MRAIAVIASRAGLLFVTALMGSCAAAAVPLDQAACDKARTDQSALSDVPRFMERGAVWAKSNATPEQMKRVARWIELEETIQFRCGQVRLTPGAEKAAAAAEALEAPPPPPPPAPGQAAAAPGEPQAAAQPPAKPKPKAKPKPPEPAAAPAESAPVEAPKPRRTPKPAPVPPAAAEPPPVPEKP